jgi:hypothetical protein
LFQNYVWKIDGDCIGFEVHAAVAVKSAVFWDVTSCNSAEGYRRFRKRCSFHVHDLRVSQARVQKDSGRERSGLFVEDMFILMNFPIWKET